MSVVSPSPVPIPMHQWDSVRGHDAANTQGMPNAPEWSDSYGRPTDLRQYTVPRASEPYASSSSSAAASTTPDARQRLSVPALTQSSLAVQQTDRRGSDEQGGKKRPQSCDICRIRKVKCVLPDGVLPGQAKCKQCDANDVLCTYAYIPKRPGPQTTSAKSIARREERERQAKAAAVAAAARAAGIRDKGKARRKAHFHEGTGSTPPSSNDVSRKSSAVVSQQASPSSINVEFRHLGFDAGDAPPMVHHHQTGLYGTPTFAEETPAYYDAWGTAFPSEHYLPTTSGAAFGLSSTSNDYMQPHVSLASASGGSRTASSAAPQSACLHSSHSRKSSIVGSSGATPSGQSHGRGGAFAMPSLSRPVSPSLGGGASWMGCLHESNATPPTVDPLEALKSLSRPSSPRTASTLPAGDIFHPLTQPLQSHQYGHGHLPHGSVGTMPSSMPYGFFHGGNHHESTTTLGDAHLHGARSYGMPLQQADTHARPFGSLLSSHHGPMPSSSRPSSATGGEQTAMHAGPNHLEVHPGASSGAPGSSHAAHDAASRAPPIFAPVHLQHPNSRMTSAHPQQQDPVPQQGMPNPSPSASGPSGLPMWGWSFPHMP